MTTQSKIVALKRFGRNIKKYRELKGLTQNELACAAGLTTGYIGNLETGKYFVKIDTLLQLCHILDCSPNQLCDF